MRPARHAARRLSTTSAHSLKRQQSLAFARPVDNAGVVRAIVDPSFELQNTIFKTLPAGSMLEKVQKTKLDSVLEWTPAIREQIEEAYTSLPPHTFEDADLHAFMKDECDFAMEHADGSFLEHLHFCRDFTALHYPTGKPRVMLMHSICGVGTNCFPMRADQLPRLAQLLPPDEMAQVQAFPSLLRLLVHGPLLDELDALSHSPEAVRSLRGVRCHRLLDNEPLVLDGPQLWEALNYQLIHAIDFLPAAAWQRTSNDFFFHLFARLHEVLTRAGERHANVGWESGWARPDTSGARPPTWRHWAVDMLPSSLVVRLAAKQVARYSADIGHSLEYEVLRT